MTDETLEKAKRLRSTIITVELNRDAANECHDNGIHSLCKIYSNRKDGGGGGGLVCSIPEELHMDISNLLFNFYEKEYQKLLAEYKAL